MHTHTHTHVYIYTFITEYLYTYTYLHLYKYFIFTFIHMQASAFHTIVEENAQMMRVLPAICNLTNSELLSESQRQSAMLPRGGA